MSAKTRTEIQELREYICAEINRLPERDTFGESNASQRAWMHRLVTDIEHVLSGNPELADPRLPEVSSWMVGNDDYFLSDFIPDPQEGEQHITFVGA